MRPADSDWLTANDSYVEVSPARAWSSAAGTNGRYRGSVTVRQRDFGITPISIAGGTVKVKDEVKIEFDVVAR